MTQYPKLRQKEHVENLIKTMLQELEDQLGVGIKGVEISRLNDEIGNISEIDIKLDYGIY